MIELLLSGTIMVATGSIIRECSNSGGLGLLWAGCGVFLLIWHFLLRMDWI